MTDQIGQGDTAALRTGSMIGRTGLLELVQEAIDDDQKGSAVLFFRGEGGIGKTRLLEEIGRLATNQSDKRLLWSGIIDLYHSEMHSNSRIEQALVNALDPRYEYFGDYRTVRLQFDRQRAAGLLGHELELARHKLTDTFIAGFQRLALRYRVVLTFDTLELIQYESDAVQAICEIEDEVSSVKNWFLDVIKELPNTVTVFAGRAHKRLQEDFKRRFREAGCSFTEHAIERLKEPEAKAYLAELALQHREVAKALQPEMFLQVYHASDNGRPIYLSLIADLLVSGEEIGNLFSAEPLSVTNEYNRRMRQRIGRRLLDLPGKDGDIVRYLAFTRQGLDRELLCYLVEGEWGDNEIDQAIAGMGHYTFIKIHPQYPHQLFLHDEIYDLLDEQLLADRADAEPTFKRITAYYRRQNEALWQKLEANLRVHEEKNYRERDELMRLRFDLSVKQLYYEFQVDPQEAYYVRFLRWSEEAIKSRQAGFDMRLRDVVLGFMTYLEKPKTGRQEWLADCIQRNAVDRNSAVHWVRRYLARGEFEKAEKVAGRIRKSKQEPFDWERVDDHLYKAALLTVWGETMLFTNAQQAKILKVLEEAQEWVERHSRAIDKNDKQDQAWREARIKGRLLNNIGFAYRRFHQFSTAIRYYVQAVNLYRHVDIRDEMADTENNLAYVYSRLGSIEEARALAMGALQLRQQLHQRYQTGISFQTLGSVLLEEEQYGDALALFQRAVELFRLPQVGGERAGEGQGYQLGVALARIRIGEAYRGMGNRVHAQIIGRKAANDYFDKGCDALRAAMTYFGPDSNDIYAAHAPAELGRLYRDWMRADRLFENGRRAKEHQELAIVQFNAALEKVRARKRSDEEADLLEDLARLYWYAGERTKAAATLEQAEKLIPPTYGPEPKRGFPKIVEPTDTFGQVLGKIYLLRADLIFDHSQAPETLDAHQEKEMQESMRHRLLAYACFEHYASPGSRNLRPVRAAIYDILKKYGVLRLERVLSQTRRIANEYVIGLDSVIAYMERTLGFEGVTIP